MGFCFVRALMQDFLRRPILGQVMARSSGMEESNAKVLEASVFLKAMGISSDGDGQGIAREALAVMFEEDPRKMEDLLGQFFGKNMPLTALCVALETELSVAFLQGAFFKCTADTGRSFYLSADLGSLLPRPGDGQECSMFKVIQEVVDRFIVGNVPLVLDFSQEEDVRGQEFMLFLDGRASDRLDKIELWSRNPENIWSFRLKQSNLVHFIAKTNIKVERVEILDQVEEDCIYKDLAFNHTYSLNEGFCSVDASQDQKLRAIIVRATQNDKKMVVLTNISKQVLSKEEILQLYLNNEPFIQNLPQKADKNDHESHVLMGGCFKNKEFLEKNTCLKSMLSQIFDCFEISAVRALFAGFDKVDVLRALYAIPARIRYQKNFVHVRFEVDENFAHAPALQAAIDRMNAFCIRDYLGRRICFAAIFSVQK